MPNSTAKQRRQKPTKPYADFPLFPHATGRWAKKVKGKLHYFGSTKDDPHGKAALDRWLEVKDDLYAGRTPRPKVDGVSVADLANHFLTWKHGLVESGELTPRTFTGYHEACCILVEHLGKRRPVVDLRPTDFEKLRASMADGWGPVRLGNVIQVIRSVFRYGYESDLVDRPVKFGPGFKKPSAKTIRKVRAANGPRMFKRDDLVTVLDHATLNMKAMTLLAINSGLGNSDVADMTLKLVADIKGGWLNYARGKTGIDRRIPLWPETITAIQNVIDNRPRPSDGDDQHLLFIGQRGRSYQDGKRTGYRVNQEFTGVCKRAGIEGRTFYDLRRTFQTIGEGAHDLVAVQAIMGHAPASSDMSAVYRQRIDDERLIRVVNYVRAWLFGDPADQGTEV